MFTKVCQKKGRFIMKNLFVFILLIILPCGCSGLQQTGNDQNLILSEIKKDHPLGKTEMRIINLTDDQLKKISQYGITINEDDRSVTYYSMSKRRSRGAIGKAFLVKDQGEYGEFKLALHVDCDTVHDIHILKNPEDQNGSPVINTDFIQQFLGKNLNSSFEIAKELDDVLTTPAKIKPIKDAPVTSQKIAESFRKWLVISKVIEGN